MVIVDDVYAASVSYKTPDGMRHTHTRIGFTDSQDALSWVAKKFSKLMKDWYNIDPNGLYVMGRIFCHEDSFDEIHEMRCGM